MKKPNNRYPTLEKSKRIVKKCSPEDFDGHTSFATLSPEQRIYWASLSAQAVFWAREVWVERSAKKYGKEPTD